MQVMKISLYQNPIVVNDHCIIDQFQVIYSHKNKPQDHPWRLSVDHVVQAGRGRAGTASKHFFMGDRETGGTPVPGVDVSPPVASYLVNYPKKCLSLYISTRQLVLTHKLMKLHLLLVQKQNQIPTITFYTY
eukprot:GSA120T00008074001.1